MKIKSLEGLAVEVEQVEEDHLPSVKLPTWLEAKEAILNGNPSPLDIFIVSNEPTGIDDEGKFRRELQDLVDFIFLFGALEIVLDDYEKV